MSATSSAQADRYKVMHGLFEVAGQNHYAVKGLREAGIEARTVISRPNGVYPYDYALFTETATVAPFMLDAISDSVKRGSILKAAAAYFDLFHFHFGQTFLMGFDLSYLDRRGKEYLFEYHGSELRYIDWATRKLGVKNSVKKRMAERSCLKGSKIVLHDDELIPYLPERHAPVHVVPLRADLSLFDPVVDEGDKEAITIVHAPSNRSKKGTEYVLRAFDALKHKDSRVNPILIEGMTRSEALEAYRKADIIVDQLVIGTYGMLSIEAMALKKPVVTYIAPEMKERLPSELPIVSATPDDLYDTLEVLIAEKDYRRSLGVQGLAYVQAYHDHKVLGRYLREVYEGRIPPLSGRDAFAHVRELKEGIQ